MELAQIRYVLMIAEYNNFSKAAEQLFITQPTLSQQIRRLEEELGFLIFKRSTRTVTLTDEGKAFVQYAQPVAEGYQLLVRKMEHLKKASTVHLSIGILPTFSHLNILELIQVYQDKHKTVNISTELHSSDALIQQMVNNHLDVILANITPMQKNNLEHEMMIRVISHDHINAVLNKNNPLSKKSRISLEDLRNQSIIMLGKNSSIYRQINYSFKSAGIIPVKTYSCPELHSMIGLIQSNTGIGFLSSRVAAEFTHSPVISIPIDPKIPTMTAIMYAKNNPTIETIEIFCEYMNEMILSTSDS